MNWRMRRRRLREKMTATILAGVWGIASAAASDWDAGKASAAEPRTALFADGSRAQVHIVSLNEKGQLTLKDAEGKTRTTELAGLITWGSPQEMTAESFIVFANGDLMTGEVYACDQDNVHAVSLLIASKPIPVGTLNGLVLKNPFDRYRRDRLLDELSDGKKRADRLILANKDEITGTFMGIRRPAEAQPLEAVMKLPAGETAIRTERIAAVAFNPTLRSDEKLSEQRIVFGFRDGSRLSGMTATWKDDLLFIKVSKDDAWAYKTEDVVFVQPFGKERVYLSDLKPESYKHIPYLNAEWPYRLDRNVRGSQLRADGKLYLKGIGMHSMSRLTFRLDKKFRRFDALAAVDDQAGDKGNVTLRVFVDNDLRYQSEVLRAGDAPRPVSVDVSEGNVLSLVVDFAEHGDEQDYADWLLPRLSP